MRGKRWAGDSADLLAGAALDCVNVLEHGLSDSVHSSGSPNKSTPGPSAMN